MQKLVRSLFTALGLACWLVSLPSIAAAETAPASGALAEIDLASDTAWTLSIDDASPRPIKVPGGGYNSDRQPQPLIPMSVDAAYSPDKTLVRAVKDHVTYERVISIPKTVKDQTVLIEFGAVNHGAEVFLCDGTAEKLVATHVGPLMPFSADITGLVSPGKDYTLRVKSYPLWHYANTVPVGFIYTEGWLNADKPGQWASKFGFGITKYVRLAIYPKLRITDIFVRPSVTRAEFSAEVTIRNDSPLIQKINLVAELSSWNGDHFKYPDLPTTTLTLNSNSETKVTIGPVPWTLGTNSFWWPNKPFREDYQAKLHNLNLTIREGLHTLDRRMQRFGFVEWGEGPYYYTVNGVRINFIGDGTPEAGMSEYDCYSTSPAFLPPTGPGTGCLETWRRFMRMGMCVNRTHQSTPTPYMMDTADELGFMLIPETAIRGCQRQRWHEEYLPQSARELAQACRNHPSVCRYSVLNEAPTEWAGPLIDALTEIDDTRPMVFEDNQQNRPGLAHGRNGGHAYAMLHYVHHPHPSPIITGIGECAWANWEDQGDGPEVFAYLATDGRCQDIAYYSGWDWINYWPNFLQGMNAKRHAWRQKASWHDDRVDNSTGWNSPLMLRIQKCFHPYLVVDGDFVEFNGPFTEGWPQFPPNYASQKLIDRYLTIFNDSLTPAQFTLRWTARWGSPSGEVVDSGTIKNIAIKPGFHTIRPVRFNAPKTDQPRKLFLVCESLIGDRVVFTEDQICFTITPAQK